MKLMVFASLLTVPALSASIPATAEGAKGNYSVCSEQVCIERAKLINESLNASVNPCDDFYSYACGGWMDKHPIPESKSSTGNFYLLRDELQMILKNILGNITLVKEGQNITDKVAAAYNACLEVPIKEDQLPVLQTLMNRSGFDQWPRMSRNVEAAPNTGNCTEVLANIPIYTLFTLTVDRDLTNLTSYVIQVDQLDFPTVGRNQLTHPNDTKNVNITTAYRALVRAAIKFMKPSCSDDEVSRLADELVDFEGQLANLTAPPEERRNLLELYHRTNISELERNFTNVPLLRMLQKQFSLVNITLSENETTELFAAEYYTKLSEFLQNVNCDTLYNYAGLRDIRDWAASASKEFRNASFDLTKASSGVVVDKPRWEKCVATMNDLMPEVVGYLYVLEKFSVKAKEEVEDLARRIKEIFNETVRDSEWMDNATKAAAEKKLAKMISKIGYPSWLLNTTHLELLYKNVPNLNLSASFLEMYDFITQNNWKRKLSHLRKNYDAESVWIVGSAVVNAFYNPSANEMVYPSGILQGVFYQYGLPRSLNFGAIGMVVGHEMTHGFDDTGSQFNEDGALIQWWSNDTRTKFNEKAKCFIDQYGNITDEQANTTLNGENTVGENIADNGGIRMAYKAYEKLLKDECGGQDTRLQGLEHLSGKQLFFVAEAMVWCSKMRTERRRLLIQYDTHSPDKYRVNIPMQNMLEFSAAFNCPSNSSMNATNRCQLW